MEKLNYNVDDYENIIQVNKKVLGMINNQETKENIMQSIEICKSKIQTLLALEKNNSCLKCKSTGSLQDRTCKYCSGTGRHIISNH